MKPSKITGAACCEAAEDGERRCYWEREEVLLGERKGVTGRGKSSGGVLHTVNIPVGQ